jgi:hypothetical protein
MTTIAAASRYRDMVDATISQRARLHATRELSSRWNLSAPAFRFDPLRPLEPNLELLASYIKPADAVVEVGGGAGRVALPMALRCARLTNVEPSEGMGEQFLASATASGINNVTLLAAQWPAALGTVADVAITEDVTYFVSDIVPFVRALQSAARRRVLIAIWSIPPPNRNAALFELVFGEPKAPAPGHRELLAVLWEMDILPDVRVLPESFRWPEKRPKSSDEAVSFALDAVEALATSDRIERVRAALPRLFKAEGDDLEPMWRTDGRGLLITWETGS